MNKTLSKEIISSAGEMFMALNFCPSDETIGFNKIIYGDGPNSRILILSMNIIKRTAEELKTGALKIFSKIASILNLRYVQARTRDPQNGDIELQKNETVLKGKTENFIQLDLKSVGSSPALTLCPKSQNDY